MKSDIEIARECPMIPIEQIAEHIGIGRDDIEPYGKYMAKVPETLIDENRIARSKLILVTAITPTKAGIGKTTVSIGLSMALNKIGCKTIAALREPSLGPCFGLKGGAAGGGYSQILPMDKINFHFTGDFHAVTSAHNMIAALLDNYIYQHRNEGFALREIFWKRVLDVNDRNLRHIITGLGSKTDGVVMESGFDITPASEIMAILCLATDAEDLRRRIENILLGITTDGQPFYVRNMGVAGSICVLLKDALRPNLVQTTENTPAIVHGGPFANIAHGCNSVIATKVALSHADYVVTEAGFGADLGAEKFFNIKCRTTGLQPALTVIVATTQGLKLHGGAQIQNIGQPDTEALTKGFANLDRHIKNLRTFGQSVVVTLNRFTTDTDQEIEQCRRHCQTLDIPFAVNNAYTHGGQGTEDLARLVVDTIQTAPSTPLKPTYLDGDTIIVKANKVAQTIYGAQGMDFSSAALKTIQRIEQLHMDRLPICIAKTQYSFSANPKAYGAPVDFRIPINDVVINSGSQMIVLIAGDMMRMPGLPRTPQAMQIDLIDGKIVGLS